ncbi:MAG: hypothetical protein LBC20_01415 [Planctomycetaceae bacterium]|jgi:hypothetical protein|nr:hypothetical protein [Planctomycetaceae bacterium]
MITSIVFLDGKMGIYIYYICLSVCVFILPLNAQESGWNGYQSQEKNIEPETPSVNLEKKQFYLLRTGFLTEGTATNDGKQYLLKTNFGTMSVPVGNVEFVGATREDVYHYKKGFTNDRDCKELIKLAEWCFNNKLSQQGISEYQRALQAAPNTVLADVIRKRLETLQNSTSEPTGLSGVRVMVPKSSEESDNIEINSRMNGISKPIVDVFAKKVQPVLVSRCAATDCHGSSSENQFKLSIPSHTLGNTTYRNLRSVLQWVNLDYPTESQLLSVLVSYHGGTKAAFSVESTQYNNIVQWVRLAAKELPNEYRTQSSQNESKFPLKEDVLPPALRNAILQETSVTSPENPDSIPVKTNQVIPSNYSPTRLNFPNSSNSLPQKTPSLDLPLATDSIKDPFDPHIFNIRYHGTVNHSEKP